MVGDILWDSELKRFGARRRASGITYVVKARIDGQQRWITLGKHGPLTPAQARALARQTLGEVDSGKDPTRERDARRVIPLFADFAERWLSEHVRLKRKASTHREYQRIIHRYLNPHLGKVRVDRIDPADALKLHSELAAHRYIANRVIAVLSALMSYAERLGHRPQFSNPCRGLERFKETKRKRPLSASEVRALWSHLEHLDGVENPFVIGAIRLLLLTGMRREEVLTLRWDDINNEAGLIRLADAKTGPRSVILSRYALELLDRLPRKIGSPFVFPGNKEGGRLVNISKKWDEIRTHLGFAEVRIHDLRHTVATFLARSASLVVVRDTLGHQVIETTSGYSHAADDDVRVAVNQLATIVVGRE